MASSFEDSDVEKHAKHIDNAPDSEDSQEHLAKELQQHGELVTVYNGLDENHVLAELPDHEQKRILRKVDLRLIPLLTFLYLIAFVDRTNVRVVL